LAQYFHSLSSLPTSFPPFLPPSLGSLLFRTEEGAARFLIGKDLLSFSQLSCVWKKMVSRYGGREGGRGGEKEGSKIQ